MDKRRRGLYAVIAAVVALAVVAVVWVLVTRASAVAIVNGERISKRDFIARMEDAAGYNVLDQMITEALIRQAAAKAGITVSKDRVEEELNSIRQQFGSSFDSVLWQYGMTEDDLRKNIEMNLLVMEYSTKDLTITDEDLRKYFEEHKDQYNTPEMVRARHILVETEEEAKEIVTQLGQGADFAQLAQERSIDTMSAIYGGDLDWFGRGQMVEPFEKAAFAMQPGQISDPVKSDFGYHIIKVEERKDAYEAVFEEVRDNVESAYKASQAKSVTQLAAELRSDSDITIINERYKDLGTTTPFGVQ
ncbi:MAG: peptidylprolyl isomerase [Bacillota bacterium]|nr:foldase [Bacillota bacterium]